MMRTGMNPMPGSMHAPAPAPAPEPAPTPAQLAAQRAKDVEEWVERLVPALAPISPLMAAGAIPTHDPGHATDHKMLAWKLFDLADAIVTERDARRARTA